VALKIEAARMSLSDPKYLLLLAAAVLVFHLVQGHLPRAAMLLGVSYGFYFNLSGYFALVLVFVTAVAYAGGILLAPSRKARQRGLLFSFLCVVVLLPLGTFKYLAFLLNIATALLTGSGTPASLPGMLLVLPIGISFFTFVALGYLCDVYLEVVEPERRPLEFALLLAFFPIVTAGPIERAGHFLPQFDFSVTRFSSDRAFAASRLIFVGLFLKIFCADTLVKPVDVIYADPSSFIPLEKLYGLIYFMFYVYSDFAGYSLIAIGSAMLFGLEVRPNFHQPFLSTTVAEFWRNWHISMSSWFRDYVFTPLRMRWRHYPTAGLIGALLIAFVIIGVWHGAGWGFVLFGVMHGFLVAGSTLTLKYRDAILSWIRIPAALVHLNRIAWTFVLVMLTFVVYRANSLHDAANIYRDILSVHIFRTDPFFHPGVFKVISYRSWTWIIVAIVIAGDVLARRSVRLEKLPFAVQIAIYNVGAALIVGGWIANNAAEPFLYYRF
jgi:alginate O-acetyltransferase complex protein AlgI